MDKSYEKTNPRSTQMAKHEEKLSGHTEEGS